MSFKRHGQIRDYTVSIIKGHFVSNLMRFCVSMITIYLVAEHFLNLTNLKNVFQETRTDKGLYCVHY